MISYSCVMLVTGTRVFLDVIKYNLSGVDHIHKDMYEDMDEAYAKFKEIIEKDKTCSTNLNNN